MDPRGITAETVVHDGTAREIASRFPRNVNTMVTCALATIGLDACRARMVAVPGLPVAIAEVEAIGHDGAVLTMRKEQPVVGVSGTEMFESAWGSICRSLGAEETLSFA
jgi:aspartate dehydrogenase